jgi:hypothetical protein
MIMEASISGVIRIIFYILLFSALLRLIARLAVPYVVKKSQENLRKQAENFYQQQQPQRPEGEVRVESKANKNSKSNDGEYVDYVEIKD